MAIATKKDVSIPKITRSFINSHNATMQCTQAHFKVGGGHSTQAQCAFL